MGRGIAETEAAAGDVLAAALSYARLGYRVFPCVPGSKKPYEKGGFHKATRDEGLIRGWWKRWPRALVATPDTCTVDIEAPKPGKDGGPDSPNGWLAWERLTAEHGVPEAPATKTGLYNGMRGGQLHFAPREDVKPGDFAEGIEVRGHGAYVLLPPSEHGITGVRYEGTLPPFDELPDLPEWIAELRRGRRRGKAGKDTTPAEKLPAVIRDGTWHRSMVSAAGTMRRRGFSEEAATAALIAQNATYEGTPPPDSDEEIADLVADVYERYEAKEEIKANRAYEGETQPVEDVAAIFTGWLELDDPAPVYAVLGAVAANYLEGVPVWLLLVAPPSSGKTELLGALHRLPDTHPAAVLSEASLLSGTPGKERAASAKGGLLREIGSFGLIICKDFTSVLSMRHDARVPVLAALREVYDGAWTRYVGSDGGRRLHWEGKVGLVGGCTPTIDRHHAVMSAMGERLLLYRLPLVASERQASRALRHTGERERAMRTELANAVAGLFANELASPRKIDDHDEQRLVGLSTLISRCRSAVERDTYSTREIELVPAPEQPARLALTLERLLAGLDALGVDRDIAWDVVATAALDSMPALRRAAIEYLVEADAARTTTHVGNGIQHPTVTARRVLEDLTAHGIVVRHSQGEGKPDMWEPSNWLRARWPR